MPAKTKDISARLDQLATEKRQAVEAAEAILQRAADGDKQLTEDEARQVDDHQSRAKQINTEMQRYESQLELSGGKDKRDTDKDGERSDPLNKDPGTGRDAPDDGEVRFNIDGKSLTFDEFNTDQRDKVELVAFRMCMMGGYGNLPHELQTVMDTLAAPDLSKRDRKAMEAEMRSIGLDARAMTVGTPASGGYLVPEGYYRKMTEAMKQYIAVEQAGATLMPTATGEDIPMPTVDDTGNVGEIVGETSQVGSQDVAIGSKIMEAHMFSSKLVRVQVQLMEDSAFDIAGFLGRKLPERIGRAIALYTTTGTGTNQPEGVVTAANTGKTTAANTAITYDELVELQESIDDVYKDGTQKFMMNQATLTVLRKLKDNDGRPIWGSDAQGRPNTILGDQFVINNNMANIGASAKPIVYGRFDYYYLRRVGRMSVFRFAERYMDYLQVGFLGFQRADGLLLDPASSAAQSPVKVLAMPA